MTRLDAIVLALCVSNKVQTLANVLTTEMGRLGAMTPEYYEANISTLMQAEALAIVRAAQTIERELDRISK